MKFKNQGIIKYLIFLPFICYFVIGLLISNDYGFSWDEAQQRNHGIATLQLYDHFLGTDFIPDNVKQLGSPTSYGMTYSASSFLIEQICGVRDFNDIYHLRHRIVFILFAFSSLCLLLFFKSRFGAVIAILGWAFYILHPRIFGHSFFNPKDIVLLSYMTMAISSLYFYSKKRSYFWIVLHAVASAFAMNARLPGSMIFIVTLIFMACDVILLGKKYRTKVRKSLNTLLYLFLTIGVYFVISPALWKRIFVDKIAVGNVVAANISSEWNSQLVYFGKVIPASEIPWHYLPAWIGITTPLMFSVFLLIGLVYIFRDVLLLLKRKLTKVKTSELIDIALLGLLLGPLVMVFIKNPNLYNGWRHFYFLYAPMVFFMTYGLHNLFLTIQRSEKRKKLANAVLIIAGLSLLHPIYFIAKHHTFETVYFNALVKKDSFNEFDQDYWGTSYLHAYQRIADRDNRQSIKVHSTFGPGRYNVLMLDDSDRKRIQHVDRIEDADYFVTNYLWSDHSKAVKRQYPVQKERQWYQLKVKDTPIVGVYKLR